MSMKKLLVGFLFFFVCGIPQNILSLGQEFNVENQIYKVLTLDEWERAQRIGIIVTELDKKDGFVHLSSAIQLNATLSLYFAKEESVMLLQIDQSKIHDGLKYEAPISPGSRTSSFPHYYGDLIISSISNIWHLNRGAFEIPIEVMLQAEHSAKS